MTYRTELAPVIEGGLTVEMEVQRSWVIKDAHGHTQLRAEVDGSHLAVELVGQSLRLSKTQMEALIEAGTRWQRYADDH